jgi:peptide/nickel transport system permease protein
MMETTQVTRLPGSAAPAVDEVDLTPVRTYWQLVRQRFVRHRLAVIAFFLMIILVAAAVLIPWLSGDAWKETSLERINQPPSLGAPLGYDNLGINTFARLMKGLQTSLFIGFAAVMVIVLIGVPFGAMAGYFGGWADNALMRVVDIVLSIPTFFLILMLVAFWGTGNAWVIIIAIGLTGWTTAARLVRGEFLSLREADFVQAGKALGAGHRRIVTRHMIPSSMAPVVVAATLGIADSVVIEAALSFLGFGITPPEASLGNMLTKAQDYFYRDPLLAWYPGITLILVVLAASFLGDGLRDALDPRQRIETN